MTQDEEDRIRRAAEAYGEDVGHENLRVLPAVAFEVVRNEDTKPIGYWVTALLWVPIAWVPASDLHELLVHELQQLDGKCLDSREDVLAVADKLTRVLEARARTKKTQET